MNKQMLQTAINVARLAGDRLNGIAKRRVNSDAGKDVKLQEVGMCELIELSKLIGSDEEAVTEVDGCRSH